MKIANADTAADGQAEQAIDEEKRQLAIDYQAIHAEATCLAGGLRDLAQRATVYHHLFQASGGNHAFPLIAAHGALWAGGYFRFGARLGRALAWQYPLNSELRSRRLDQLETFADALRDINRRVCVDTYTNFHFTSRYGNHPHVTEFVAPELVSALRRVHEARQAGYELSDREKEEVFLAHFLDEQSRIVGPAIEQAAEQFDWALVRSIALRPIIRFAYFPGGRWLRFRNFASREERVAKGLQAFAHAAHVGWTHTENAIRSYRVLPNAFFSNSAKYFAEFRSAFLATTAATS